MGQYKEKHPFRMYLRVSEHLRGKHTNRNQRIPKLQTNCQGLSLQVERDLTTSKGHH